jgi:tetratricopeptide (TPR) repeat protein
LLRDNRPTEAVAVLLDATKAAEGPQQSARASLLYAQALDADGKAVEAAESYRKTLEFDPTSAAAEAGLGRLALAAGDTNLAAESFHKAARIDPQYRSRLLDVGAAYEKSGKRPEAIALYRELADDAAAKERLARLLVDGGDPGAAIPALEAAVKQSPTVANRLALADAYKLNKQTDNAIGQLQLAVASEPSNYELRMDLGRELRDQRRFVPAAEQFSAAARLRPDSVNAWNELAAVFVVNEDYANGLAALDRVRALGKEVPGDFFYRAIALEKLKQPKPALEAYRQFLASDGGRMPDQEFQARQRVRLIESELNRK